MVVGKQFMHFISIRNKLNFNIMKTIKYLFTTLLLSCATVVTAQRFEVNGVYYVIADSTVNSVSVIKNFFTRRNNLMSDYHSSQSVVPLPRLYGTDCSVAVK